MKIGIHINQTCGSSFFMLIHGTLLKRRWEGELELPAGDGDEEALGEIFRVFNVAFPPGYAGPSLSVADVVTLEDERSYEVASFGFKRLGFVVGGEEYRVRLPRPTIAQIKEWRTGRRDANLSYTLDDFYRTHNFCRDCKGNGADAFGARPCATCAGSGEYPQTVESRVSAGFGSLAASIARGARGTAVAPEDRACRNHAR